MARKSSRRFLCSGLRFLQRRFRSSARRRPRTPGRRSGRIPRAPQPRVRGIGVSGQQHGFVPLDEQGRGDPAGQAVVRHQHRRGMRTAHAEARRRQGGHPPRRPALPARLHRAEDPLAQAPRAAELPAPAPRAAAARLPQFPPHRAISSWSTATPPARRSWTCAGAPGRRRRSHAIDPNLADWLPPLADSHQPAGMLRPDLAAEIRPLERRGGQRGRRRQHDGRDRHGQRRARRRHRQLRHERHDLRLRQQAGRRSAGRDRGLLLLDRRLAAAALHDERHDRDRAGARAVRMGPRAARRRRGRHAAGRGRPGAAAVPRGRAHAQRAGRLRRLSRAERRRPSGPGIWPARRWKA